MHDHLVTVSSCHLVTHMALTKQQLETILDRALPGEQLREWRALPDDRYALATAGGERLNVQVYTSAEQAATAAAALDLLRGEIDLPIPQLRANDATGDTVGVPYLLLSDIAGEPLEQALPHIGDEQLYKLGRRLGETICRVHRLSCERYGSLNGEASDAKDERSYVLERLDRDVQRCGKLGLLDRHTSADLTEWFAQQFQPVGRQPALVCGEMNPRTILVRPVERGWSISGLTGWGQALGWSPAWDHVILLDATDEPRYFGLRVGYGNGYDDNTTRTYEQVREHALAPYRLLLLLDRMQRAYAHSDIAEIDRRRGMLKGWLRVFGGVI
jgi:aminoglycoside phosphotransferase (APT) family kinase protein